MALNTSKSLREYYIAGKYKGYYKLSERHFKQSGKVHMIFTNGEKELFAVGKFKEETLINIFKQIDNLESGKGSSSSSEQINKNIYLP